MELAVTALLRTLVAEHRAGVPEPLHLVVQQAMLDTGANTTRGTLGTQGEAVPVAIDEGIHFLFDDIGNFTDRPLEQLGLLDDRHADFPVAIGFEHAAHAVLDKLPGPRLLRQDIVHAPDGLQGTRHAQSSSTRRATLPRR